MSTFRVTTRANETFLLELDTQLEELCKTYPDWAVEIVSEAPVEEAPKKKVTRAKAAE